MINARIDLSAGFKTLAVDMPNLVRRQVGYAALRTTDIMAKMIKDEVDKEMATTFHKPTRFTMSAIKYYQDDRGMTAADGFSRKSVFTSHVSLIREGMRSRWSKAAQMEGAAVEYGDAWEKALTHQFGGGYRRYKPFEGALLNINLIPPGHIAVPTKHCPMDAYDNPQKGFMVQLLAYFKAFPEKGYKANMDEKGRKRLSNKFSKGYGSQATGFFISMGKIGQSESQVSKIKNPNALPAGIWQRVRFSSGSAIRPIFIFVKSPYYRQLIDFKEVATWTFDGNIKDVFNTQLQKAILTSRDVRKATGG